MFIIAQDINITYKLHEMTHLESEIDKIQNDQDVKA